MINEASLVASENADDDDRPLSMWFGGMQHSASVGESSKLLHILVYFSVVAISLTIYVFLF